MAARGKRDYLLTVLTGPNAGAQQTLTKRRVTLSASGTSDFYLDGLDEGDVEITVAKDRVRVASDRGDVALHGKPPPPSGQALIAQLPATFDLGHVAQINISTSGGTASRGAGRLVGIAAVLLLFAGGGVALQSSLGQGFITEVVASTPDTVTYTQAPIATTAPVEEEPARPKVTFDDARTALENAVENAGLDGLTLRSETGVIRVTGTINKSRLGAWNEIRKAYDSQFGLIGPLLVNITEESDAPPLAVASVWLGENPQITTRDGTVMGIGDGTESGWKLSVIEATSVKLTRGRQTIVIEF
ncbi:MAG: EscD/YscD/HrpQ family type III secretion system periplasmic domain-containing protein [Pseudomonadota bacterium]